MDGFMLPLIAFSCMFFPVELEKDTHLTYSRHFDLPLLLNPEVRDKIDRMRLYVSRDHGKTWKVQEEIVSTSSRFSVSVTEDGRYWFALQLLYKGGKADPMTKDLRPNQKILVNADRRIVKTAAKWIIPPPSPTFKESESLSSKLRRFFHGIRCIGEFRYRDVWVGSQAV